MRYKKTPKPKYKQGQMVTNTIDTGKIIDKPEWDKIPGEDEKSCWWYMILPIGSPEWNWIWAKEQDLILITQEGNTDEKRSEAA